MKYKLGCVGLNWLGTLVFVVFFTTAKGQDTLQINTPLEISGSGDVYYKYDFAGGKTANIHTVFVNESNSVSIGMIDIGMKKRSGKASFVGELGFGPRGQYQSIPDVITPSGQRESYHIQNLYVSYDFTDKLNITGGYMSTFIGYETVSPLTNFNYSTSYLNTNGPFQNAGVKLTYVFNEQVSVLAGIFEDYYNVFESKNDVSTFGGQLSLTPVKGLNINLNAAYGYASGLTFDLTATYQISDDFKLGLNGTHFKSTIYLGTGGYDGVALYTQYQIAKAVTFGLRTEYYASKNGELTLPGPLPGNHVIENTLSANIKAGPLTLIPEIRLDVASDDIFVNSSAAPVKTASQALLALIYAF